MLEFRHIVTALDIHEGYAHQRTSNKDDKKMSVRSKAEALYKELKSKGFNGVAFDSIYLNAKGQNYKDAIDDGRSEEWAQDHENEYAIMSFYPEMEGGDNEYNGFNAEQFEHDLRKKVISVFGKQYLEDDDEFFSLDLWGGEFEIYDRNKKQISEES